MPKFTDENLTSNSIVKSRLGTGDCIVCGEKTLFIDYIIESRICSTECQAKFYKKLVSKQEINKVFLGYCKECLNEVYSSDRVDDYKYIYECSKCGYPHLQNELL